MNRPDLELLKGAIDVHAHTSPALFPRCIDDIQLAHHAATAGMRGFVLKDHDTPTVTRAYHLKESFPELEPLGGIVLNRSVGGLDPAVVQSAIQYGAKIIWMPTNHSKYHAERFGISDYPQMGRCCAQLPGDGLTVIDDSGQLKPEVLLILELIAEADVCVGTGHLTINEIRLLLKAANERGVMKFLVTHVNWDLTKQNLEVQEQLMADGAYMEYCAITYISPAFREQSSAEFADWMRATKGDQVIISSDLGQMSGPPHPEGLRMLAQALLTEGVPYEYLEKAMKHNPAHLCGLPAESL